MKSFVQDCQVPAHLLLHNQAGKVQHYIWQGTDSWPAWRIAKWMVGLPGIYISKWMVACLAYIKVDGCLPGIEQSEW